MTSSTPSDFAPRLAVVIARLTRRLRSAKGGLSHGLLSALASADLYGPMRLADLAAVETVSAPSMTRVAAELESQGLLVRTADPDDGRASLVEVTEAGRQALVIARRARDEIVAHLLDQLDLADRTAIEAAVPALERMIALELQRP